MTSRREIIDSVENRSEIEAMVLRAQMMSQGWVKLRGREDGETIADEIIAKIVDKPDESEQVGDSASAYIKSVLDAYHERGIPESMVEVWRVECATAIYDRFTEFRDSNAVSLQ